MKHVFFLGYSDRLSLCFIYVSYVHMIITWEIHDKQSIICTHFQTNKELGGPAYFSRGVWNVSLTGSLYYKRGPRSTASWVSTRTRLYGWYMIYRYYYKPTNRNILWYQLHINHHIIPLNHQFSSAPRSGIILCSSSGSIRLLHTGAWEGPGGLCAVQLMSIGKSLDPGLVNIQKTNWKITMIHTMWGPR